MYVCMSGDTNHHISRNAMLQWNVCTVLSLADVVMSMIVHISSLSAAKCHSQSVLLNHVYTIQPVVNKVVQPV